MTPTCVACGDTGKDSRGMPCRICVVHGRVRVQSPNTGRRLVKDATDPLEEAVFHLRRQIAAEERVLSAREPREETPEEARAVAEAEKRRLLEEISRLEGDEE